MTSHYSEDDLTLYYYGEGRYRERPGGGPRGDVARHLRDCPACAAVHQEIVETLSLIAAAEVPERGEQYGLEVWQRIRTRLPERESGFQWFAGFTGFTRSFTVAAAAAVLMLAAFIAGRYSSERPMNPVHPVSPATPANPEFRQRILLTSVADHLDRSERMLTDIMNAADGTRASDISAEQRWAADLLTTSRLYRQDAVDAGERSVAGVLDDLERSLLEIVHSPSTIGEAELEQLRRRIDAAALLFKVRVMGDELRRREDAPADRPAPRASTSSIS